MKNMTIGKKIGLGFGMLLVLAMLIACVSIVQVQRLDEGVADLSGTHLPLVMALLGLNGAAIDQNLQASLHAIHKDPQQWEEFKKIDTHVDDLFAKVKQLLQDDQELVDRGWTQNLDELAAAHDVFVAAAGELMTSVDEDLSTEAIQASADSVEVAFLSFIEKVEVFVDLNDTEAVRVAGVTAHVSQQTEVAIYTITAVALVVGLGLAILVSRGIKRSLQRIAANLGSGAAQTAAASGQVAQSSQMLAEGASEQAASLEETSASLEEITSMTQQNAANAGQAKGLTAAANASADKGAISMQRMSQAIDDIKKSSDATAKIVKTIDEIAFQTNLLALNAAVEAARAGDSGKGFAVVAEEVRNLAQRSADAAKNTAALIEAAVENAENGVQISRDVGESLQEIGASVRKVNILIEEIVSASNEQASGIEQVNTAVAQMERVTQSNAASSEETASASEELSAQAGERNRMVQELIVMVDGVHDAPLAKARGAAPANTTKSPSTHIDAPAPQPRRTSRAMNAIEPAFHR